MMNTSNPPKDISQRNIIVVGTFLALVSMGLVISSFGVFFKPLSSEFGWTRGDTSGAFSTAMLISGIMAIVLGRLADRISPRLIITGCGVLAGFAILLLSQTHAIWQLYFYFGTLVGCSMGIVIPITTLIAKIYKRRRGLMTGITLSGGSFGSIVAAPFITLLIHNFGWQQAYLFLGSLILVIVIISALLLRDPVKESPVPRNGASLPPPRASGNVWTTLRKTAGSTPFWLLGIILFSTGFAQSVMVVHIIPHATDIGLTPIVAASILTVFQGASVVGNFTSGKLNDIIGGRLAMVICLSVLVLALIILLVAGSAGVFYIVAILFGIGAGGSVILRSTIAAELFGLNSLGTITGAIMFISTIGGAVGPLVAGYIFDISNQYFLAFITTIVVCIIGLVMACLLKFGSAAVARSTPTN